LARRRKRKRVVGF